MKALRVFLLMVLVLVLPVRGAFAVTMAREESGAQAAANAIHHHHDDHAHAGADHHSLQSESGGHRHGHSQELPGTCSACALGCCAAVAAQPSSPLLHGPVLLGLVTFPQPLTPTIAFLSDGPERPPRSI